MMIFEVGYNSYLVKENCMSCGAEVKFKVNGEQANDLIDRQKGKSSKMIQNIIPEVSSDKREILISQICGKCFDEMGKFF